jgi:hypothetical protein
VYSKKMQGLEFNVSKTSVLPKGCTQQAAFDVVYSIINNSPTLTQWNFVSKTCRDIIDDVEKLDVIQDGLVHYELLDR